KMSYNSKNLDAKKDEQGTFLLKVKPGKYKFQFYYNSEFFEIKTDSIPVAENFRKEIRVTFESSKYPVECDKPVIYVYPTETTQVNIKLDLKGKLGFTYPEYKNNWNFTAEPNGTLTSSGKKYDYLFWEGSTALDMNKINTNEGFIVNKSNLIKFFEEKLTAMGLNAREQEDFITYWGPRMSANENNYVHFIFNEEFSGYALLTIEPKPDKVFRVFMIWSATNEKGNSNLTAQKIPSFDRKGFTVLEWGGTETKIIIP
ncbi:MAG: hypothetical protein IAF38_14440, partial [Bacteroidia bacterium]|nr:hypothetical protein [Bacteroidia bacterium]